jgi:hypothetical protein
MTTEIKQKVTFGGCDVERIRPTPDAQESPVAINIELRFEEALKLRLSLEHALLKLNAHNRSTSEGKRSGINICLFPHKQRITVNPVQLKRTPVRNAQQS